VPPNYIDFVESYEFYPFFNAAISPQEYQLNIVENFSYLNNSQLRYLFIILANCRSKEKINTFLKEFEQAT
jgi:hypothetical protein